MFWLWNKKNIIFSYALLSGGLDSMWPTCKTYSLFLIVNCSWRIWVVSTRKWCIHKLGIFHANQTSMCFNSQQNLKWGWRRLNMLKPSSDFFSDRSKASLLWIFCHWCFTFVFIIMSCLFLEPLWSPARKGLTPWLSCVWYFLVSCVFPICCLGSGVVLDCIESWPLILLYF